MDSKIFTSAELKEIEKREMGDRSDKYGTFANRIKPKIKEMLDHWFHKKEELTDLITKRKK